MYSLYFSIRGKGQDLVHGLHITLNWPNQGTDGFAGSKGGAKVMLFNYRNTSKFRILFPPLEMCVQQSGSLC